MKKANLVKRISAVTAAALLAVTIVPSIASAKGEVSASTSTFKADTDSSTAYQTWRSNVWNTTYNGNTGLVALTPGKNESGLNFAWYSETKGTPAIKIFENGNQGATEKIIKGTATAITAENMQGNTYAASNKVSVDDYFKAGKTYTYAYTDNYVEGGTTTWSTGYTYKAQDSSQFSVILTGDPQIGASGSSDDNTSEDSSIARDTYNWDITMNKAMEICPNAAFLLSAGDQINENISSDADKAVTDYKIKESEYAGYLYPSVFRSLPIATTIGNHDRDSADYTNHFNNPNSGDDLGKTTAGCDYYFTYGNVLFISLNSNNRNQEEHRSLMQKAVESAPEAAWKVVIFHSDIYGSGAPHADTDAATNRVIFAPLMDEFGIDVCLTGHDHTYSRSYQILDGNVIDYDISDGSVTNPEGTLYVTTGSGSGSKYYDLLNYTPYYIADRTNECLPAFSTLDFSDSAFTIKTYDYNGGEYAEAFTIKKTADEEDTETTLKKAADVETDKYTDEFVAKLTEAVNALKALVASYKTADDTTAITAFQTLFGTDDDPVSGYGSVKNAEDKDTVYGGATEDRPANRFKYNYSTLLDKTIYTQLANADTPVVDAKKIIAAQKEVNDAINALVLKKTVSENADVNAGNNVSFPWEIAAAVMVVLAGGAMVAGSRKEKNCKEK